MGLVLGKQTHGRNFRLSKCHREDFSSLLHAYQELPRTDTDKHLFNSFYHGVCYEILLFSSISLHWLLRKAFLSLLAILWNSAFRCLYLTFSPLLFASLLFTAIFKASPDSHFAFNGRHGKLHREGDIWVILRNNYSDGQDGGGLFR